MERSSWRTVISTPVTDRVPSPAEVQCMRFMQAQTISPSIAAALQKRLVQNHGSFLRDDNNVVKAAWSDSSTSASDSETMRQHILDLLTMIAISRGQIAL